MNQTNIKYICNELLEVDWTPKISTDDLHILDLCDSKLEIMFLFGAFFFLEQACSKANSFALGEYPIQTRKIQYLGKIYKGFCITSTWPLWYAELGEDVGPQSVLITPQIEFGGNYHQDFGIFYGDKNGEPESFVIKYGVEIDGYNLHKTRRDKDKYRDNIAPSQVIRLLEEIHNPLKWFKIVMQEDSEYFYQQIEKHMKSSELE